MNELLEQGLATMGIGMGTVLLFLCTMILAMFVMSWTIKQLNKIFPEAVAQTSSVKQVAASDDSEIAVAIVASMFKK